MATFWGRAAGFYSRVVNLVRGFSAWRLVQLIAAVILSLTFGVPLPKLVCSHCRQGECGACPAGRMLRQGA